MLCRLSLKNIKKSIKDYSIYFFTLVFAVAIFYIFNSLDSQNSMLALSNTKHDIAESLVMIINYVSVFVSIILGFLIIYSNNFLIKRRKKEIGMYLTLGMSKQKVSTILVIETLFIGLISLAVGLIGGVFLSQFLSIFTAKLFEANMTSYSFVFSMGALIKTIIYFGIMFVLVMIFNVISLSRYKLIDLINAKKKNEQVKFRNKYVTIISFILAVATLGYAYYLLFNNALLSMDSSIIKMLIFGSVGTFLLFFSLSGFLLKLVQNNKKMYYKGLNMFVLKQVNNKINTTVFSTTLICLMLLLTIGILSGSIGLTDAYNSNLSSNNLTDFTLSSVGISYTIDEDGNYIELEKVDINQISKDEKFNNMVKDYAIFTKYYDENLTINSFLTENSRNRLKKKYGSTLSLDFNIPIIKESEYKSLMKEFGKEKDIIDIKYNEYILLANLDLVLTSFEEFYSDKTAIKVNDYSLIPGSDKIIVTALENFSGNSNDGVIVVSDDVTNNLDYQSITMVGNYKAGYDNEEFDTDFSDYIWNTYNVNSRTKIGMATASLGIKIIVTFIGLYLGIIFAICSATILAIGQLSESSDNKERYLILKQLGADDRMTRKALIIQIAIAFGFPLVIAIIHSYFGLKEINSIIEVIANLDLASNILLTSLFIIVVYGGYFLATYLCSKNIIKNN